MDNSLPTAKRLVTLELIEQISVSVTEMLNGQTDTIEATGRNSTETLSTAIEAQCDRYYQLLENIQVMLRQQFRHLTEAGITDADVLFRSPIAGLEKDHDLWRAGVVQLRSEVQLTRQMITKSMVLP
ncbi:hypothetical protein BDF19DRAFT_77310 [Syncephalis fuscata]|nr:hypothetical protein BDF19DRAFT_77310 [Syncephalis fuscata]